MAKAKKKRADKYDEKLAIEGSFEDVIKVSVSPSKTNHKMEIQDIIDLAISMYPANQIPKEGEDFIPRVVNGEDKFNVHLYWEKGKWHVATITEERGSV